MKILIVDDEPAAASMLQILINRHIVVDKEVLTCNSAEEALELMAVFQPTLLLLDVEMPSMNGFDLQIGRAHV